MLAQPLPFIPNLHEEYHQWINELNFYKEEIILFEKQLDRIVNRNKNENVLAQAEEFKYQFTLQKEVIDNLKYYLHTSEKNLTAFVRQMRGMGLSSVKMDNHSHLRDEFKTCKSMFNKLKTSFRGFEMQSFKSAFPALTVDEMN
jgi:hypothetical protein